MHEAPRPNRVETTRAVAADQAADLEVTFPEAPAHLTATEITATLTALTYLHDLAIWQERPELLKAGIVEFEHPRHRLRTHQEAALRVARINYGSPFVIELVIPATFAITALALLIREAGGIVKVAVQEHAETKREGMRQQGETEREGLRQQGENERESMRQRETQKPAAEERSDQTTGDVPSQLRPVAPQDRGAGGGDNAPVYSPRPPTHLAKAPQQMLRDIMINPEKAKADESS